MNLVGTVTAVHDLLGTLRVDHAFGGALALAYYTNPRSTDDVDVNIFVAVEGADPVVAAFAPLGFTPESSSGRSIPLLVLRGPAMYPRLARLRAMVRAG